MAVVEVPKASLPQRLQGTRHPGLVPPCTDSFQRLELALQHRLPALAGTRAFPEAGGLMSYAGNLEERYRGAATYVNALLKGAKPADLQAALNKRYAGEPFVSVLSDKQVPSTRMTRGSNRCVMNVFADRQPGRAIVVSAIDNLVKGASGQAVQNMNVSFGFTETDGLQQEALFP